VNGRASIRTRLLVLLLSVTAAVWAAVMLRSRTDARRELNGLFDAQLAQSAKVLLAQASHDVGELRNAERARERFAHTLEHPYEQRLHFQLRDRAGHVLYRSSSGVPEPLATDGDGYYDRTLHGLRWRVLVLTDAQAGLQIETCQRYDVREQLAGAAAWNMTLPLLAALPLLATLIWIAVGEGIRPLARVEREFARRASDDLHPFGDADAPRELVPLVGALNGLLVRLDERFELERRFTADAAHELRTPLAAIRAQAQVATTAGRGADREHALRQIVRAVDRATHLVEQLLTLARLDPQRDMAAPEAVDLRNVATIVAGELAAAASGKQIDVRVEAKDGLTVSGDPALLSTLLCNLVENGIRYCGRGGSVRIVVTDHAVEVVDDGPGIPAEEREHVFERFHRVLRAGPSGSGLGLSIVKRIADLHHASVTLGDGDGGRGLRVTVRFGGAAPALKIA
jgi:two-component system sensor histidine kinase QseC